MVEYDWWVMFSIQKLIGRDEKFYDLLEASAQQAHTSVHQLIELLQKLEQHDTPENLEQFAHSRREDKRITQELTEQLSKTFVRQSPWWSAACRLPATSRYPSPVRRRPPTEMPRKRAAHCSNSASTAAGPRSRNR